MKIIKSKEFDLATRQGLAPTPEQLEAGDIAVNYLAGHERIYMKNSEGEIVEFEPTSKAASANDFNVAYELFNLPIDKRLIVVPYGAVEESYPFGGCGEILTLSAMPPAGTEIHVVILNMVGSVSVVIDTSDPNVPIIPTDNEIIESDSSVIEINLISNGTFVLARSIF